MTKKVKDRETPYHPGESETPSTFETLPVRSRKARDAEEQPSSGEPDQSVGGAPTDEDSLICLVTGEPKLRRLPNGKREVKKLITSERKCDDDLPRIGRLWKDFLRGKEL